MRAAGAARRGQDAFLAASRGSVTSFWRHRYGGKGACRSRNEPVLPLAGDGDVFAAAGMAALLIAGPGNRAGDLIGIDTAEGGRLGKIARLSIGPRGVHAAFVAHGEALVDAIAIRLIGDDEYLCVRGSGGCGEDERAGQKH